MTEASKKTPEQLLALHERAEAMMKGFSYKCPDSSTGKGIVRLARTDTLRLTYLDKLIEDARARRLNVA